MSFYMLHVFVVTSNQSWKVVFWVRGVLKAKFGQCILGKSILVCLEFGPDGVLALCNAASVELVDRD